MKRHMVGMFTIGSLTALLIATSAVADDARMRWYGSFTVLHNMPSSSEAALATRDRGTFTGDIELSDEPGFALAVGFETAGGQQVELEAARRTSDIEGVRGLQVNSIPIPSGHELTGELVTLSLMVNARQVFDLDPVRPYIGAGVGLARHDGNAALSVRLPAPLQGITGAESGDDTVFAYQLMVGFEVDLAENMTMFGGYRYMTTRDIEIERLAASFDTQAVEVGIRLRH